LQYGTYYYVGLFQFLEVQQRSEAVVRRDHKGIKPAAYILAKYQAVSMNITFASVLSVTSPVIKWLRTPKMGR
jgi:hypothetical protein